MRSAAMETPPCFYARRVGWCPDGASLIPPLEVCDREGVFSAVYPLLTMPPQTEHKSPRQTCLGLLCVISSPVPNSLPFETLNLPVSPTNRVMILFTPVRT
jgi:hypothetical protein